MITMLRHWQGSIQINDKEYDSAENAISEFKTDSDNIHIILKSANKNVLNRTTAQNNDTQTEYEVTVKQYMTKKATPEFDFMAKWNNDVPMPLRTMRGTIEKETRGMVYMKLHGFAKPTITCFCCGKELTNPISRQYGIGPVCLSKIGISRDIEDVSGITEELVNVEWEGWIIRSSILKREEV